MNSDELKKVISSDGLVSHIAADKIIKQAFIAFDHRLNNPFDVIAAIFASLVDYVDSTNNRNTDDSAQG